MGDYRVPAIPLAHLCGNNRGYADTPLIGIDDELAPM
jgi:hypothetical protein